MKDIYYSWSEKEILSDVDMGKAKVPRNFFSGLHEHLSPTGAVPLCRPFWYDNHEYR